MFLNFFIGEIMTFNLKRVSMLLVAILFTGACSSTTMIRSTDAAAQIYVDGNLMGTGTATHTDTKIVGSTTNVRIEKEGCMPQNYSFSRSEKFSAGACAGGVFVLVPFLWIMEYNPEHTFHYTCQAVAGAETPAKSKKK